MACKKQQLYSVGLLFTWLAGANAWSASTITAIDFSGTQDPSQLTIQADGPISVTQQTIEQDRQVILEIENATLPRHLGRRIDTSSFDGNVSLISPYQVEGSPDTVRIVIQLRGPGSATLTEDRTSARLLIPRQPGGSVSTRAAAPEFDELSDAPPMQEEASAAPTSPSLETSPMAQQLDAFIGARDTQRFSGKPISIHLRDVDVQDVFRLIADASGFNIILGDEVKGKLTLSLGDVPWDQALDVILRTLHLGAERNNNILRVVTLENLANEKLAEMNAKKAAKASAPRITRIFPVSFANLEDLEKIVSKFASTTESSAGAATAAPGPGGPGARQVAPRQPSSGLMGEEAIVQIDNRTNSIVVRDLPENLERIQKLIALLDTQTPQVIIEAKIVEASESFSKTINGSLGVTGEHGLAGFGTNRVVGSMNAGNPLDALVGEPGVFVPGETNWGSVTRNAGLISFSPSLAFVNGFRLNAILNMGENESKLKVISAPKTVVLNKESAKILQATPVLMPGTTTVAGVGTVPSDQPVDANLSLEVKPTVTNEGSVLMNLAIERDIPVPLLGADAPGIGKRNIKTIVLVESGSTLVIGGIYTMSTNEAQSGFPFLRKIPILGAFFGTETGGTDRSELFIFITPRILNPKEAGLTG